MGQAGVTGDFVIQAFALLAQHVAHAFQLKNVDDVPRSCVTDSRDTDPQGTTCLVWAIKAPRCEGSADIAPCREEGPRAPAMPGGAKCFGS